MPHRFTQEPFQSHSPHPLRLFPRGDIYVKPITRKRVHVERIPDVNVGEIAVEEEEEEEEVEEDEGRANVC